MAEQQTTSRKSIIFDVLLPPANSMTIGEIENRLVYITPDASQQTHTLKHFTLRNGKIFKSVAIPLKYFNRYHSSNDIERELSSPLTDFPLYFKSAFAMALRLVNTAWNLASPFNDSVLDHTRSVKQYHPCITQQVTNVYEDSSMFQQGGDKSNDIMQFDYHPLYKKIIIALKNGIVFFDMNRDAWLCNTLQCETQTNITDFSFSHSGHMLAVVCSNGVFLWQLAAKHGSTDNGFVFRGELIAESLSANSCCDRVIYSPCDKYIAVYKRNGRLLRIYDVCTNKMVYRHQLFHAIRKLQWIASTKHNDFCPLRLAILTKSQFIFVLNLCTFQTETYHTDEPPTSMAVSQKGDSILVVVKHKHLYHISLKRFSEPLFLADLSVKMGDNQHLLDDEDENDDAKAQENKNDGEEQDDEDAKAESLPEAQGNVSPNVKQVFLVKDIEWSPCGRRIAVVYEEYDHVQGQPGSTKLSEAKFLSLLAFEFDSVHRLGFITHPHGSYPLHVKFRKHVNDGALMAVCWNNGIISQHHLCYASNKSRF